MIIADITTVAISGGRKASVRIALLPCFLRLHDFKARKHDSQDSLVRLSALHALVSLEHEVSASQLAACVEDSVLRASAFELLGFANDEASIGCLLKGLELRPRASREAAMGAILQILSRLDGEETDALVVRIRDAVASAPSFIELAVDHPTAPKAERV